MRILTAGLGAVAFALLSTAPASASVRQQNLRAAGDVEFGYSAPEISEDGDHVLWKWTVTNRGSRAAHDVVMTHKLLPALPVTSVSGPCKAAGDTVRCRWATLAGGRSARGVIKAELPENLMGTVNIKGRIVWRRDVAPDPVAAAPAATTPTVVSAPAGN
ncbi:hypothetical protein [Actinocorallia longicatena]|uniref:DUF11 domain-containing protein n=1 Tax=Actinocorallia longicatena TaxID=111803 RepID=A0ABP6QMZ1_9ACTN